MPSLKSLVKDTAVYGLSSIVGRFLNWCLTPLYTIKFAQSEYGVVTLVYAVAALALIILTYGMETGFFRFANHDRWKNPLQVYSTALISLAVSSTAFLAIALCCLHPAARWLHCPDHPSFVAVMAIVMATDAFMSLPFSYLRYRNRPVRFAVIKLIGIAANIGLNLFFILACPVLMAKAPQTVGWFYNPAYGVGYIFVANLISNLLTLLLLLPTFTGFRWTFSPLPWRKMLAYSAPLLVLGIAGIMNQTLDKIIFPVLYRHPDAMEQLGIYGANYKVAIIMVLLTQAFRFAYEPFIFSRSKEIGASQANREYGIVMRYFIIVGLATFLGVMYYLDILRYFLSPRYFSGLKVVPIVMWAELFYAIFYNLAVWYKLCDKTIWGMWFSLMGLAVTIALNIILVPRFGYMGSAWAALSCYAVMMVASYIVGQHFRPIPYHLRRILLYALIFGIFYALGLWLIATPRPWLNYTLRALCLIAFAATTLAIERCSKQ